MQKDNSLPETGREIRMWVRDVDLTLLTSAQLDFYIVSGTHALILDFKTGFKHPTPSEISWQSRTQSIALCQAFPHVTHVRAGFAISRLHSNLDLTDYSIVELNRIFGELRHVLWRARQEGAPRVPGLHCRYCRAQGVCRENATYAMLPAGNQPMTVPGRGGALKADELAVALYVGKMTPREMGFVYQRQSVVDSVFQALKARLLQLPEDQLAQAGYKKVDGNRNKEITDAPTAFSRLSAILTDEERWQCVRIVRGSVTDSVADRLGITKKEAEERVLAAMGDVVVDKPGNPKLKPL